MDAQVLSANMLGWGPDSPGTVAAVVDGNGFICVCKKFVALCLTRLCTPCGNIHSARYHYCIQGRSSLKKEFTPTKTL